MVPSWVCWIRRAALATPGPEWRQVSLAQLQEFFRNPCRALLRRPRLEVVVDRMVGVAGQQMVEHDAAGGCCKRRLTRNGFDGEAFDDDLWLASKAWWLE